MRYTNKTLQIKKVADYAGISIFDVGKLSYYDYRVLLRDALIYNLSQTDSGRDYLLNCWIYEQTEPDDESISILRGMRGG